MEIKERGGRALKMPNCSLSIAVEGQQSLHGVETVYKSTGGLRFPRAEEGTFGRKVLSVVVFFFPVSKPNYASRCSHYFFFFLGGGSSRCSNAYAAIEVFQLL